jgi:vacuolar-type H+-ATPase subunit I/STV1
MNITLKKTSWHFKIYSNVISETPPKSLCPYFWCWVVIIVGSPFFILCEIMKFLSKVFEGKSKPKKLINEMTDQELIEENEILNKRLNKTEIIGKIFLGVSLLFGVTLLILSVYLGIKKDGWYVFLRTIFCNIGIWTTIYWTVILIMKCSKKIKNSNVIKVPVEMIKSVYTKTCPIINWK